MSFGKPTVAFDLVEHRRSALEAAHYIEPNDVNKFATGVRELLEDEERRQRMARFAKKRFQEVLAWDLTEATLVRTYEELLNGSDFIVPESRVGTHRYSGDPVVVAGKVA